MVDKNFDDTWELKDPHSGEIKDTISAQEVMAKDIRNKNDDW